MIWQGIDNDMEQRNYQRMHRETIPASRWSWVPGRRKEQKPAEMRAPKTHTTPMRSAPGRYAVGMKHRETIAPLWLCGRRLSDPNPNANSFVIRIVKLKCNAKHKRRWNERKTRKETEEVEYMQCWKMLERPALTHKLWCLYLSHN